jgi:hypothetical protein
LCLRKVQSSGKATHPLGQHYLVIKASPFSSFPLSILTSRGLSITFSFLLSFPLGSLDCLPRVTLVTPKCGTYIEVTLGVVSYSYSTFFVVGLGIFPTYNLCDNILAPLLGRILNPLHSLITLWQAIPKPLSYRFPGDSTQGTSLSTLDELLLKLHMATPPSTNPPFLFPFSIL